MCGSTAKKIIKYAMPAAAIAAPFLAPAVPAFLGMSAPAAAGLLGGVTAAGGRMAIGQDPLKALMSGLTAAALGTFGAPLAAKGIGAGLKAAGMAGSSLSPSMATRGVTGALPSVGGATPALSVAQGAEAAGGGALPLPSISASPLGPTFSTNWPEGFGLAPEQSLFGTPATVIPQPIPFGVTLPEVPGRPPVQAPPKEEGAKKGFLSKAKEYALPIYAGTQLLGAHEKAKMLEGISEAQGKSYEDYLQAINVPESVKQTRFQQAKSEILGTASQARRRLRDQLAGRGIRGVGVVGPATGLENTVQDAINRAYWDIYGTYNVPETPGPVMYAPGAGELLGSSAADLGTLLFMSQFLPRST